MLRNSVKSHIERFCDLQESSRSVCQFADNRTPSWVRNGAQNVCQLIHEIHYTIRCNLLQALFDLCVHIADVVGWLCLPGAASAGPNIELSIGGATALRRVNLPH